MHRPLASNAAIHLHNDHHDYDEVRGEVNFVVDLEHRDAQAQAQNSDDDLDGLEGRKEDACFRRSLNTQQRNKKLFIAIKFLK